MTNRELMIHDPQGCPMFKGIPLTDKQIKSFCDLGCSVICKEEMIKNLIKLKQVENGLIQILYLN